ncbi:peptidoglycan-associated lipoprotein Pal [Falsirhodobacter sp. 20TX0035]|uniref:peptidoglycan-associated lipoprotein Pal n=1 Tax=Falsirhodobacter sp. 20TX0035 TaxID=3022019 RepID=UPI002330DF1D|nr:peptidoglycan-associated lipoprotein Pal [Falsirhodobacter sp. 20TX0035]MDB6453882.1 peptidoglycan-associated lipoprotein Pal [Falsirhodobacter sp. 20TX0035]
MSFLPKALMLVAVLGVAACNNPNRFGAGGAGAGADGAYGANGAYGQGGVGSVGTSGLGDPNDPNSQAYFSQRVGDRILFNYDQATLNDEGRQVLAGQAQWLNSHPGYAIIVEGHADEKGTREYNLALGARRASSAQDFLISQGVAPSRIRTVSYGKERPAATCSEESCYAQNRRAVTVLQAGAGA